MEEGDQKNYETGTTLTPEIEVPKKKRSISVMNLNVKILHTMLTNRINGTSKRRHIMINWSLPECKDGSRSILC